MSRRASLAAIVLAAGRSSRMGRLKQLLPVGGLPAVLCCARTFSDIGVEPLVVLGFEAARVAEVLDGAGVAHVTNHEHERGMYSSVRVGMDALGSAADWVAVLPADVPLVRAETVGQVARSAVSGAAHVVYPAHRRERGHPPLLSPAVRGAVLAAEPVGGLREVLADFGGQALDVSVPDRGIFLDMDDPRDYERIVGIAAREGVPAPAECRRLRDEWQVSVAIQAHCDAVAGVAVKLGRTLTQAGAHLNVRLLEAAALLHDAARGRRHHAAAGAAWLDAYGWPRVAAVVAQHMDICPDPGVAPGEAEVLYLADKLVRQVTVVSLPRRLEESLERYAGDAAACSSARRRLQTAMRLADEVERLTGRPLDRLLM